MPEIHYIRDSEKMPVIEHIILSWYTYDTKEDLLLENLIMTVNYQNMPDKKQMTVKYNIPAKNQERGKWSLYKASE